MGFYLYLRLKRWLSYSCLLYLATTNIWATLVGVFFLGENLTSSNILGAVLIILGITFITR